jgi:hypothetical protein
VINLNFSELRDQLIQIRHGIPCAERVAVAWDGDFLTVIVANPKMRSSPFQMKFDSSSDYLLDPEELIKEFADQAKLWFEQETYPSKG